MTEPIRVLWLIKGLGPGGAERLLVTHARLRDRARFSYEVAYLVPYKDHLVADLAGEGVPADCLDGEHWWDLRWIRRLRRRMVAADVVHSHSPFPAAMARLLSLTMSRRRQPMLVYTEHNEWGKHRRPTRWLNRLTLPLEDAVVAVSEGVNRSMKTRAVVEVVHHWIDAELVRAQADREGARAELGFGPGDVVVGTVANLRWEKGYDVLLEAANQVVQARPDITFIAVGQGPLEVELRARRDELDLNDRFRFLGYRADAVRVMSGFDVFCLPSRHEGLPVALMEARALGLPIIATNVGGVGEGVVGSDARLLTAGSSEELAAALLDFEADSASGASVVRSVCWPSHYEAVYGLLRDPGG